MGAKAAVSLLDQSTEYYMNTSNHTISSGVFVTDDVPYSWRFSHSHGIVRRGGADHTAAGLCNDVPMLSMSLFLDKNLWAARLRQSPR